LVVSNRLLKPAISKARAPTELMLIASINAPAPKIRLFVIDYS
jgi:hypothetical protein